MMRADLSEPVPLERPPTAPRLLLEFLDATRSSLWVLDPDRFLELRACIDDARRWGELAALEAFWRENRTPEDESIDVNWFDPMLAPGMPLAPEPPFVLACACMGLHLDATQQHAALPVGRLNLLFDPTRPACHRWIERQLDQRWHASFLPAREVLRQLPERLDQGCRGSLTDWLYERRREGGLPPNPIEAADLFEHWAHRYADEWRAAVVEELTPLAERDAQLIVFTDD